VRLRNAQNFSHYPPHTPPRTALLSFPTQPRRFFSLRNVGSLNRPFSEFFTFSFLHTVTLLILTFPLRLLVCPLSPLLHRITRGHLELPSIVWLDFLCLPHPVLHACFGFSMWVSRFNASLFYCLFLSSNCVILHVPLDDFSINFYPVLYILLHFSYVFGHWPLHVMYSYFACRYFLINSRLLPPYSPPSPLKTTSPYDYGSLLSSPPLFDFSRLMHRVRSFSPRFIDTY